MSQSQKIFYIKLFNILLKIWLLIIYKWMIEKNYILYNNKTNLINIYYIKKCLYNMWIIINKVFNLM